VIQNYLRQNLVFYRGQTGAGRKEREGQGSLGGGKGDDLLLRRGDGRERRKGEGKEERGGRKMDGRVCPPKNKLRPWLWRFGDAIATLVISARI